MLLTIFAPESIKLGSNLKRQITQNRSAIRVELEAVLWGVYVVAIGSPFLEEVTWCKVPKAVVI